MLAINRVLVSQQENMIGLNDYQETFCFPVKVWYDEIGLDVSRFEELNNDYFEHFEQLNIKPNLFEATERVLAYLAGQGVECHIVSAAEENLLRSEVEEHGISQYFASVRG